MRARFGRADNRARTCPRHAVLGGGRVVCWYCHQLLAKHYSLDYPGSHTHTESGCTTTSRETLHAPRWGRLPLRRRDSRSSEFESEGKRVNAFFLEVGKTTGVPPFLPRGPAQSTYQCAGVSALDTPEHGWVPAVLAGSYAGWQAGRVGHSLMPFSLVTFAAG